MPLVEGFGQDVRVHRRPVERPARRELSHVLKVFLIDRARRSSARSTRRTFLHPQTLLNDIETLLMEDGSAGTALAEMLAGWTFRCSATPALPRAGAALRAQNGSRQRRPGKRA